MEKPFDRELSKCSKNQLIVLRYMLGHADQIVTSREIAKKTGIVEKSLGGVLSALSRKTIQNLRLIEPMGRDGIYGLRWKLSSKAITVLLAERVVKSLILGYK